MYLPVTVRHPPALCRKHDPVSTDAGVIFSPRMKKTNSGVTVSVTP